MVRTSLASCKLRVKSQCIDLIDGEHGGLITFLMAFPCDQGSAESSHDTGNIRTDALDTGNFFKASQNCIVVECSTLYHNVLTEVFCVGKLDYLI